MPFNGSGVFVYGTAGVPFVTNTVISSSVVNTSYTELATALTLCVTKDGQSTTSAVIPFAAGIRVSDGSAATPSLSFLNLTDAGFYRIASDNFGMAVAGVKRWDIVAASVTLTQDLLFTDATHDIGKTGATRPRDFFLSRNAVIGGTLDVTGAVTGSSTGRFARLGLGAAADATAVFLATQNNASLLFSQNNSARPVLAIKSTSNVGGGVQYNTNSTDQFYTYFDSTQWSVHSGTWAESTTTGLLYAISSTGNTGVGVNGWGTSAARVLGIGNGTEPSTSPADMVQLYSVDLSAGNATLGLRTETAVAADAARASTHSLKIRINGTTYRVLISDVA